MELVLEPEQRTKYDKCKYAVKYWEHQFKKKNGRLPSKLDIREASNEIRYAYKTYFNLKSAALEASFQNIDGFDSDDDQENNSISLNTPNVSSAESISYGSNNDSVSHSAEGKENYSNDEVIDTSPLRQLADTVNTDKTWGSHLSNLTEPTLKKTTSFDASSNFTKKLFKNSNASKRNLRKSLSFHHRTSESSLNASGHSFSLSQPSTSSFNTSDVDHPNISLIDTSANDCEAHCNFFNQENLRVTKIVEPVKMNALNVVQTVLDEKYTTMRNVNAGWMQRVALSAGTKMLNKSLCEANFMLSRQLNTQVQAHDEDSDDIIEDSDEEEDSKLHFSKKRKLNDNTSPSKPFQPIVATVSNNSDPKVADELIASSNTFQVIGNDAKIIGIGVTQTNPDSEIVDQTRKVALKSQKSTKTNETLTQSVGEISIRKSTRSRRTVVALDTIDQNDENDPFANDEENDPDFSVNSESKVDLEDKETFDTKSKPAKSKTVKSKTLAPKKRSNPKSRAKNQEEEAEHEKTYELEFSIKPRRVTVPRDTDFKNVLKKSKVKVEEKKLQLEEPLIKTKHQQKMEKLELKIKSGNLNDNFVRINIEKKKYSRGKKSMNFSKYKKQQYMKKKQNNALCGPDMDMTGCDGGQLTCFNCGQVGHFAQKCPMQKGDVLLPLVAGEEDYCPFPTLEEASEMAKSSQLAVRKTRNVEAVTNRESSTGENFENNVDALAEEDDINTDDDSEEDGIFNDANNIFSDDDDILLAETQKLEEYVRKLDEQQFIDDTRLIKAYYHTAENGELIDTPQEVFDALQMFGHSSFRDGQEKAIMRILSGQSTLVTLSTGTGKSLCYQLPAYLVTKREPCIVLVISPLVSLMEDQITGIPKFLKAECLHTNKTKMQKERILNALSTGDLQILLVSPEAVVAGEKQTGFGSLLRKLPPIAFACIDEAHCVSQWSHNFRPSYLMICSILQERLGIKTILGLTATATRVTSDSIIAHLAIPDGRNGIISDIPLPNNLRLTVSKDGNRDNALVNLILSERFKNLKSIIIYCTRRNECERIASLLRTSLMHEKKQQAEPVEEHTNKRKRKTVNVAAEPYHAGLAGSKRKSIQNKFMRGDLRIVIATVAFGMGINKSDIRAVIHYNLPKNFESYVQEVGRAGRDGLPAHCHLFLDAQGRDEDELQRHIFSDSLDRHVIRKLNSKVFVPCTCKGVCPKHEVAFSIEQTVQALDIPEENISTLLCYLELHEKKYIEVLSSAYVTCKITSYGSANYIRKAAQDCPPLAMALAMFANKDNDKENIFEFPIVDVASAMGWDSGICKYKLKNLEWTSENGQPKRSFLTVQFINLGFRLLAPGNLTDEQLDEVLDSLYSRVQNQEKCALLQLRSLHETVITCAETTYRSCIADDPSEKEIILKKRIREYFESAKPLSLCELKSKGCDEGLIANDCRAMINMYRDNTFSGRALARIFYGIPSPNYPAVIWGRCKYWRAHIRSDFHKIVLIATKEILKHR